MTHLHMSQTIWLVGWSPAIATFGYIIFFVQQRVHRYCHATQMLILLTHLFAGCQMLLVTLLHAVLQ